MKADMDIFGGLKIACKKNTGINGERPDGNGENATISVDFYGLRGVFLDLEDKNPENNTSIFLAFEDAEKLHEVLGKGLECFKKKN